VRAYAYTSSVILLFAWRISSCMIFGSPDEALRSVAYVGIPAVAFVSDCGIAGACRE
jgi:hypothetical protein